MNPVRGLVAAGLAIAAALVVYVGAAVLSSPPSDDLGLVPVEDEVARLETIDCRQPMSDFGLSHGPIAEGVGQLGLERPQCLITPRGMAEFPGELPEHGVLTVLFPPPGVSNFTSAEELERSGGIHLRMQLATDIADGVEAPTNVTPAGASGGIEVAGWPGFLQWRETAEDGRHVHLYWFVENQAGQLLNITVDSSLPPEGVKEFAQEFTTSVL